MDGMGKGLVEQGSDGVRRRADKTLEEGGIGTGTF